VHLLDHLAKDLLEVLDLLVSLVYVGRKQALKFLVRALLEHLLLGVRKLLLGVVEQAQGVDDLLLALVISMAEAYLCPLLWLRGSPPDVARQLLHPH
jgi:hypothetical protein